MISMKEDILVKIQVDGWPYLTKIEAKKKPFKLFGKFVKIDEKGRTNNHLNFSKVRQKSFKMIFKTS